MTHPSDDRDDWEIPDFGLGTATQAGPIGTDTAPETATAATFAVANPPGTVTAIASIGGRVQRIELAAASKATASMTEGELAQEILLVGKLAGMKARSELFTWLIDRTDDSGQDPAATARLLRDDMDLPTPEQAAAAQAEAFGAHYREPHG